MRHSLICSFRFLLIFTLVITSEFLSAQSGDACSSAKSITSLPYSTPTGASRYSTFTGISDYGPNNLCNNTFTNGSEHVFTFTATTADSCISLKLNTFSSSYPAIFVTQGCPSNFNSTCIAQATKDAVKTGNYQIELNNISLIPGNVYYILVETSRLGLEYNFELSVTRGTCSQPNPGENCATAYPITSLPYTQTVSTCVTGDFVNEGNDCYFEGRFFNSGKDVVFSYRPTTNQCVTVSCESAPQSGMLSCFQSCPNQAGAQAISSTYATDGKLKSPFTLNGNRTYYFILSSNIQLDSCGSFDFKIEQLDQTGANCFNPYVLSSPIFLPDLCVQCKVNDFGTNANCSNSTAPFGSDMLFTYNSPGNECLSVSLIGKQASADKALMLTATCPTGGNATCFGSINGDNNTVSLGLDYVVPNAQTIFITAELIPNSNPLSSIFDLQLKTYPVSVEGSTCPDAIMVSTLPYFANDLSTACKGNDYVIPGTCSDSTKVSYTQGNDLIVKITPSTSDCIKISATNISGLGAFTLLSDCPSSSTVQCLGQMLCSDPADSTTMEYSVTAGSSYYLVITSDTMLADFNFDLSIAFLSPIDACELCAEDTCTSCLNAGFEQMNLDNWKAASGLYTDPDIDPLVLPNALNNGDTKMSLVSAGGYDPIVGKQLKTVSPVGGDFALKLGDSFVLQKDPGWAETISYTYTVDSATSVYYYYYALVMEDPEHSASDQPYFKVVIYDQQNNPIPCSLYEVRAAANIPGFKTAESDYTIKWKDWTLVGIPLIDFIGEEVTVEFTVKDCKQGGHFGYAYIDASCTTPLLIDTKKFYCKGMSTTLNGPPDFASYSWSTGETTPTIVVDTVASITLEATTYSGCVIKYDFEVNENPGPAVIISDSVVCGTTEVFLNAQVASTSVSQEFWSLADSVLIGDTVNYSCPAVGTYSALFTFTDSICTYSYPHTVTFFGDSFALLADTICFGDSSVYNLNYPDTLVKVKWFDNDPSFQKTFFATGDYDLVLTRNACSYLDTARVTVITPPAFSIGPDQAICENQSVTLQVPQGNYTSILWNTSETTQSISTNSPGYHQVTASMGPCLLKDSMLLQVDTLVIFQLPPDTNICGLTSFVLTTGLPLTGQWTTKWQDNSTTPSYTVTTPGIFYAEVSNGLCKTSDTVRVLATNQHFVVSIPDSTLCVGDSYVVNVLTNAVAPQFLWQDSDTSQIRAITAPGTYTVVVRDSSCVASTSFVVSLVPRPTPSLGPDLDTCSNVSLRLNPGYFPNSSYLWNTGETSQLINVTQAGHYEVTVAKASCSVIEAIDITLTNPPNLFIGLDTIICADSSLTLSALLPGATSYQWSTGETTPQITVTPPGTFQVSVITPPCVSKDQIVVSQDIPFKAELKDYIICPEDSVLISANLPNVSFLWNTGDTTSSIVGHSGNTYFLSVRDQIGCVAISQSEVGIDLDCPALYVPNVFSPDQDGYNELFIPQSYLLKIESLQIFNRIGEQIFVSYSSEPIWNGTYRDKLVKEDTYIWKIVYKTYGNEKGEKFGHVTVLP